MKNKLKIVILILLTITFSCNNKAKKENKIPSETNENVEKVESRKNKLEIKNIPTVPASISGCGCYLSLDKNDYESKQYISVDDYNTAYLFINGKTEKFKIEDTKNNNNGTTDKILRNDNYKVTIKLEQIELINESWTQKGFLEVESENGKIIKKEVYGTCGC